MDVTYKPLTKRQRQELAGYVTWGTSIFRAVLFLAVIAGFAWFVRAVLLRVGATYPAAAHPVWWILPSLALAAAVFRRSRRWTGGPTLRTGIRADLERGEVEIRRVTASEAIEVEPGEDEGPTFFLHVGDGKAMVFAGQYLEPFVRRGFPWAAFDILEAPVSRLFLGLVKTGDRLIPDRRPEPLTWEEAKKLGVLEGRYRVLDVDFAAVKRAFREGER
jgi:hypothetical protein